MNLADTYAFSGTVTGTPDTSDMKLLLNTTISSQIAEFDISSTYVNSSYDTYYLDATLLPASDARLGYLRVFVGGTIQTGTKYSYNNLNTDTGQRVFDSGTSIIRLSYNSTGSASGEGFTISGHFQNINNTAKPFCFSGFSNTVQTDAAHVGNIILGGFNPADRSDVVNGIRLLFSAGDIASGTVKLYGLRA